MINEKFVKIRSPCSFHVKLPTDKKAEKQTNKRWWKITSSAEVI